LYTINEQTPFSFMKREKILDNFGIITYNQEMKFMFHEHSCGV